MKSFNSRRLMTSGLLILLIIILLIVISLDVFTYSRYETTVSSENSITTAIYLLDDSYQTINVKIPDVAPGNNQYTYSFSISNYKDELHCDTNLKYHIYIRTTTNMPFEFDLFDSLDVDDPNAHSVISSNSISPDNDGTYFRNILTADRTMLYSEDKTDNYTLLFTYPANTDEINYRESKYSGIAELIEINIESSQILQTDI